MVASGAIPVEYEDVTKIDQTVVREEVVQPVVVEQAAERPMEAAAPSEPPKPGDRATKEQTGGFLDAIKAYFGGNYTKEEKDKCNAVYRDVLNRIGLQPNTDVLDTMTVEQVEQVMTVLGEFIEADKQKKSESGTGGQMVLDGVS